MTAYPSTKAKQRVWLDDILIRLGDILRPDHPILDDLRTLRAELHNRAPVMQTPVKSQRLTAAKKHAIIATHRAYPSLSQAEIAAIHSVNPGRVSNTLAGIRT